MIIKNASVFQEDGTFKTQDIYVEYNKTLFEQLGLKVPTTYDELERFISIYNPSETILITNLPNENELDYIISYAGISSSLIHKIHITDEETPKMSRVKKCELILYLIRTKIFL